MKKLSKRSAVRFSARTTICLLAWLAVPLVTGDVAATPQSAQSTAAPASTANPLGTTAPSAASIAGHATAVGGATGRPSPPVAAVAQTPLPPARPVDAILADAVAAMGGAVAIGRHHSLHTKMEISFKGLGITGTAEHYGAVGDKALTITEIPSLASTREGSDGTHFWSEDPINGLRVLEGAEAEQAHIEVAWNAELRMKDLFTRITAANERAEDGGYLECLSLTPKVGPGMTNCFDPRTHLMVKQEGVRTGPQGDMPFAARLSDWRRVGDVKVAYATDMQVGPLAFSGRVVSVELDLAVEASLFEMPRPAKADTTRRGANAKQKGKGKEKNKGNSGGSGNGSGEANQSSTEAPFSPPVKR